MYLQLAEADSQAEINPYIFFPDFEAGSGGVYIREDKFDSMPTEQYKALIKAIAPLQPATSGGLSESRLLASRQERKATRQKKKDLKNAEKESKTKRREERGASKNEARQSREQRKAEGKGFDFNKLTDTAGALIGKFKGGEQGGDSAPVEASKPFYTNPIFIGGAALILGAGIYFATKKK